MYVKVLKALCVVLLILVVRTTSGFDLSLGDDPKVTSLFNVDSAAVLSTTLDCDRIVDRTIRACLVTSEKDSLQNLSFPFDFQTKTLNQSFTLFPGGNKTCYYTETVPMYMLTRDHMAIYNETDLNTLDSCDLIIGAYMYSIGSYSFHRRKIYMSTTPLPFEHEHKKVHHEYMFSMWPSYHSAIEAVNLFVQFKKSHEIETWINVFMIRLCETLDATNYVNNLYSSLKENGDVDNIEDYSIHAEVKKLLALPMGGDDVMQVYDIFDYLRQKMSLHKYDVVILLMDIDDVKSYMKVLNFIFSKAADLERREAEWLIPDITFGHRRGMLESLLDVHVIQTKLTFLQHKPYDECEMIGSGVEHRGLQFAVETLKNAFGNLTMDLFSMHNFWTTIRTQRQWADYDHLAVYGAGIRDGTYPRDVSISFLEHTTTTHHTQCRYKTTSVYINADNVLRTRLHPGGGFSEAKVYQPYNNSALFYGHVPPDAELEAVLVEDEPFIRKRDNGEYEGIAIDVFDEVCKTLMAQGIILNLNKRRVDFYGGKTGDKWNGAFGELENNPKTKVALGQISITEPRKRDFAFTPPFGFIHRTYLIRKQEKSDIYLQFLRPFEDYVWSALLLIVFASALYIFILDRWNPFRDHVPRSNRFTGYESFWYSYLTMCHLSAPFAAKNLPIQIFSIFFWFFSMIVVGSYTGNLASSLTDAYFIKPKIASDIGVLPLQNEFRFGCVAHSATSNEMKNITGVTGETLYDIIQGRGDFVENYQAGFERVRNEKYILIGTSGVMSHFRNTDPDCALELNSETYYDSKQTEIGFAMRKDWELKQEFSDAMSFLMETGRIAAIYNRWQKQGACVANNSKDGHARMDFKMLTGLFIMLALGIVLSYIFLAIKLTYLKVTGRTTSTENEPKSNSIEMDATDHGSQHSKASDKSKEEETKVDDTKVSEENETDNVSEYENVAAEKKQN